MFNKRWGKRTKKFLFLKAGHAKPVTYWIRMSLASWWLTKTLNIRRYPYSWSHPKCLSSHWYEILSPNVLVNHQLASHIQYVTGFAWPAFRNRNFFCPFFLTFCWTCPYIFCNKSFKVRAKWFPAQPGRRSGRPGTEISVNFGARAWHASSHT